MIVGLGIDITELDRINRSFKKFGERFLRKILTQSEIDLVPTKNPIPYIASRFAAKEAAVKALGTGFSNGITPHCIEIAKSASGVPRVYFLNKALDQFNKIGGKYSHISITHGRDSAAVVIIIES